MSLQISLVSMRFQRIGIHLHLLVQKFQVSSTLVIHVVFNLFVLVLGGPLDLTAPIVLLVIIGRVVGWYSVGFFCDFFSVFKSS